MFEKHMCPNEACEYVRKLRKDEKCPLCGEIAKEYGAKDATNRVKVKIQRAKNSDKLLTTPEMSDEDIQSAIYTDMIHLSMHEAGSGWMRLGTLFSGKPWEQMLGNGFKMLVDQNKILIRQNELILRALKK